MKHLKQLIALIVLCGLGVLGLTACGGNDGNDGAKPLARGPVVNGQQYCAYESSPKECENAVDDNGNKIPQEYWYQMKQDQPAGYNQNNTGDLLAMMFLWHLMYQPYYASPAYYNHYVPTQNRSTYVKKYVTPFNKTYGSQVKKAQSKATYKTSSGKTVKGTQIKPKQFTVKNNGGSRGKNCALGSSLGPVTSFHVTPVKFGGGGGFHGGGSKIGGGSKSGGGKSNTGGNRGQGGKSRVHC